MGSDERTSGQELFDVSSNNNPTKEDAKSDSVTRRTEIGRAVDGHELEGLGTEQGPADR